MTIGSVESACLGTRFSETVVGLAAAVDATQATRAAMDEENFIVLCYTARSLLLLLYKRGSARRDRSRYQDGSVAKLLVG